MTVLTAESWPEAPAAGWLETCATIHMWTQIVGKVKLACAPMQNHWWQVAFYLTTRGFTTGLVPYGGRAFEIEFDLLDHRLTIATSEGERAELGLKAQPLPEFYAAFFGKLRELGITTPIWPVPVEVVDSAPFTADRGHSEYRPDVAERLRRILLTANMALAEFRSGFVGKCSPVHFFWGSFDLAVTRFSGRVAPVHPGGVPNLADWVTREAYSHEVSSCGFWPGTAGGFERPAFYAYAYPEPTAFATIKVAPHAAFYHSTMREFLLPYDAVRGLADPAAGVGDFLRTTYAATADLGGWDRAGLERRAAA
jgi:hypothetical protein